MKKRETEASRGREKKDKKEKKEKGRSPSAVRDGTRPRTRMSE